MPSSYFPLDVNFFDHPKVVPLSDAAVRLHLSAIGYANRLMTDGFIAAPIPARLGGNATTPGELARAVLWHRADEPCPRGHDGTCPKLDGGGWRIHDFLEHNRSREARQQAQEHERDRKAAWRDRQRATRDTPNKPNAFVPGDRDAGVPRDMSVAGTGNTETETETETSKFNTVVEQARPLAVIPGGFSDDPADILDVWDAWKASTGKQRADLNPARRRAITKALDKYPVEDVLDAVQGWVNDPWPERPQHHDITQLLHMGTTRKPLNVLEKMRDLWRDGPPPVMGRHTREMAEYARQMTHLDPGREATNGELVPVDGDRALAQRELPRPEDRTPNS